MKTIACKLEALPELSQDIDATLLAFANACNFIHRSLPEKVTNAIRIQVLTYHEVRHRFGLSANLTIRAIARVAAHRKTAKKEGKRVRVFRPTTIDFDSRTFTLWQRDWTVSLTLLKGRARFKLKIGNYQQSLLKGQNPKSATLSKRQDGRYYIHINIKPTNLPEKAKLKPGSKRVVTH